MDANHALSVLNDAGLDTEGAIGRMMNNPAFYLKMLGRFQQDTAFEKLRVAVEAGDTQAAGAGAHALKGVASTLGMTELSELCAKMQFLCQGREEGDPAVLFARVAECYAQMRDALARALGD